MSNLHQRHAFGTLTADNATANVLQRQYQGIKRTYPDAIIFFEVADGCVAIGDDVALVLHTCDSLAHSATLAGTVACAFIAAICQQAAIAAVTTNHQRVAFVHAEKK